MELALLIAAVLVVAEFRRLRGRLTRLERDNADLRAIVQSLRPPADAGAPPPASALAADAAATPDSATSPPPLPPKPAAVPPLPPEPVGGPAGGGFAGLETRLTGRWLVWTGGVALALGGAFLVQVSIESGLLSPAVRLLLGLLLAAGLVAAGEWLRRRPPARGVGPLGADHLAPTVAGAGLAAAYAALYAAHGLYGLIAQGLAFAGLAAVSFAALVLALRHGPAIAALGIVGAYAAPAVVGGDADDGIALFAYLATVSAVATLAARWRGWSWMVPTVHWGGVAWVLAWLALRSGAGAPWPAALYLLFATALAVGLRRRPAAAGNAPGWRGRLRRLDGAGLAVALATLLAGCLLFLAGDDAVAPTVATAAALAVLLLADDRAGARPTGGGAVAALVLLAAGALIDVAEPGGLAYAVAAAAGLTAASFVAAHGSARAGWFTLVGGSGAPLLVAAGYAGHGDGAPDADWALAAAAVAALHTAVAGYAARLRTHPPWAAVLAGYATAALGGLALGAALLLRDAGLTVALAWTVAAAAAVHRSVPVAGLRTVALALAITVIVRLDLNPEVLSYGPLGPLTGLPWIWPAYGLSALAFVAARAGFARTPAPRLHTVLEAGALSFAVLLVSLQIRLAVADGPLDRPGYDLLEQGLNAVWWLAVALLLYARAAPAAGATTRYGWRVLGALGAAQVLLGTMLAANPLWTDAPVGAMPLVNALLPAYALPALLAAGFAGLAARRGARRLALGAGAAGLAAFWMWLALSVRQAFQGTRLAGPAPADAELYTQSVVWLAYGAALLAGGLWRGSLALRYASLLVVLATVAKVFLVDMAALTGLWRAVSFLGLGGALIGIGYAYQRFVLVRRPAVQT
ncbi:DUF2339 domain-containing protein [Azospirillum sp. ST 5-10]|uniref:DUF2339 domain-containing protein n=1 Tax=unclassified Azospirillum TaxID=2630922 RepID=UPI003F4A0AFA